MNLDGGWRAEVADDDLRRLFPDPSFDDDGWEPIVVPESRRRDRRRS